MSLPENLRTLFWDCDFDSLDLGEYRNFIIHRVLDRGDWEAIKWLRRAVGDEAISRCFLAKRGGSLDPRKLRFWALILDLPDADVDEWVARARSSSWYRRTVR